MDSVKGVAGSGEIQYVILSNEFDYTEMTFGDVIGCSNVQYCRFPLAKGSSFQKSLFKIHGARKANVRIILPGQAYWNDKAFAKEALDGSKPVCFIHSFRRIERFIRSDFFSYVEHLFPRVYHVAWWDDLVKPCDMPSLAFAKEHFDMVMSYDEREANRYDITYYPSFHSLPSCVASEEHDEKFDICFVGYAKNRLEDIYQAYEVFAEAGMRCRFVLNGVPRARRRAYEMVSYNQQMTYKDVLRLSMESRCILEIIQKGSTGQSLRVNEAFMLGKRLLSNNPSIEDLPQFDGRYMRVYAGKPTDEDVAFLGSKEPVNYIYPKQDVSPIRFIEFIDDFLMG